MSAARYQVGSLPITVVSDGRAWRDAGAVHGLVPKVMWQRLTDDLNALNQVPLALNCLLLESDGKTVLIETGQGDKDFALLRKRGESVDHGLLLQGLARLGVQPDDVDIVINTHLHNDHCGWNTRRLQGALRPTFPRARYYAQRGEWDAATHPNERTRAAYLAENLTPVAETGQLELIDGETPITSAITVIETPGHTADHASVLIRDGGETAVYIGDLVQHRVQLERAAWISAFDVLPPRQPGNQKAPRPRGDRRQPPRRRRAPALPRCRPHAFSRRQAHVPRRAAAGPLLRRQRACRQAGRRSQPLGFPAQEDGPQMDPRTQAQLEQKGAEVAAARARKLRNWKREKQLGDQWLGELVETDQVPPLDQVERVYLLTWHKDRPVVVRTEGSDLLVVPTLDVDPAAVDSAGKRRSPAAALERWLKPIAKGEWGIRIGDWFQHSRLEMRATSDNHDYPAGTERYQLFLCATATHLDDLPEGSGWARRTITRKDFGQLLNDRYLEYGRNLHRAHDAYILSRARRA